MKTNRSKAGGLPRGTPASRRRIRPPGLILLALAAVGLAQAGCRSDGCNTCGLGGFGSRLTNGVQAMSSRVFNHKKVDGGCCGGGGELGVEEGVIVDSGIPVTPVAPGAMVTPGPLIPAPVESAPTDLRPLDEGVRTTPAPSGASAAPTRSQSRNTPAGTSRSAYEASRGPSGIRGRGGDVARAIHSPSSGGAVAAGGSSDLLDNIPPVDLPAEVTRKAIAPSASQAVAPASTAPSPAPEAGAGAVASPSDSLPAAAPAAENDSAAEGAIATLPAIAAPVDRGATPGILRCSSVEPHLMGGSLPSAEGLDWLKRRGYKTFLDLRARDEVDPSFIDSVLDRGMVYIALPILANRLDASRLARFDDLISQADNRPLYFCDVDGSRAGLVWYIHRMTVDRYDAQSAAHEAEEMGLQAAQLKEATAYLANGKAAPGPVAEALTTPEPEPGPIPAPLPDPAPKSVAPSPKAAAAVELPALPPVSALPAAMTAKRPDGDSPPPAPIAPVEPAPAPEAGDVTRPQASNRKKEVFRDPGAWKPIAALILAGVGVPLAYWSRSAVSMGRRTPRASLTAGPRKSLQAPPESGA